MRFFKGTFQSKLHSPCSVCIHKSFLHILPPTKEEVNVFARVCLSVCLLARLLKNACMNLDEMLHLDRCRSGHGRTD